jgi:hypothetical protein
LLHAFVYSLVVLVWGVFMNTLTQEPIAWIKYWAYQSISPDGGVEADDGFEVCRQGEFGVDKLPAIPVFTKDQLEAAFALGVAQEREAVIAWIGDSYRAYPIMGQLFNFIKARK